MLNHFQTYSMLILNLPPLSLAGYASQFNTSNLNTFDSIKGYSSQINLSELYKFMRDYEFGDQLSKEEHLVRYSNDFGRSFILR